MASPGYKYKHQPTIVLSKTCCQLSYMSDTVIDFKCFVQIVHGRNKYA